MLAFFIFPNLMPTVYSRICSFEETSLFRFNQKGRLIIGALIAHAWRKENNVYDMNNLSLVQSEEKEGIFMVLNYPDTFTSTIDTIIKGYVKRVIEKGERKRITEKPNTTQPRTTPISYSSDSAKIPKKRTRKPIQSVPKSECSGKKLINKK